MSENRGICVDGAYNLMSEKLLHAQNLCALLGEGAKDPRLHGALSAIEDLLCDVDNMLDSLHDAITPEMKTAMEQPRT